MTLTPEHAAQADSFLDALIREEAYLVQPLLPTAEFIRFCRERGLEEVTEELLERLEELGQFLPVMRFERFPILLKVETLPGGKYRVFGVLRDDEVWAGETQSDLTDVAFEREWLQACRDHGWVWAPGARPFRPWSTFVRDRRTVIESYYSAFQLLPLGTLLRHTSMTIPAAFWPTDPERLARFTQQLSAWASRMTEPRAAPSTRPQVALLCQRLANRYLPLTRTDRRTLLVPGLRLVASEDWDEVRERVSPRDLASACGVTAEEVGDLHSSVAFAARDIDPLAPWYPLVSFVSVQQRDRLLGTVQQARTLYAMEHMLRLFYRDLTGEDLPQPHEGWRWRERNAYGEGATDDVLEHLTYLVNQYHLNPKPRLILVVEGPGEYEQFPRLLELFGTSASTLGIELYNLQSISHFEGDRNNKYGALEKFIDDHHHRQTPVLVVLDREGRAPRVREKLLTRASQRDRGRNVTTPDLLVMWEKSVEFDNFTNEELAWGLTTVGQGRHVFTAEEVEAARNGFGTQGDPLQHLYKGRVELGLPKPELLRVLCEGVFHDAADPQAVEDRPLLTLMRTVIERASLNHQPTRRDIRHLNQRSGLFGEVRTDDPERPQGP